MSNFSKILEHFFGSKNLYKVLGVDRHQADVPLAIENAYKKFHPGKNRSYYEREKLKVRGLLRRVQIYVQFISYSKCSNWRRIPKLLSNFGCLFIFAILLGQIKSKLYYRLVTYKLASP